MGGDVHRYVSYYANQNGIGNIGPVYKASYRYQRGQGLGSIFAKLWRFVKPLVKSGIKTVGKEALNTGIDTLSDISSGTGKPIKEIIRSNINEAGKRLKRKAEEKIQNMVGSGLGIVKKPRIKEIKGYKKKIKHHFKGRTQGNKIPLLKTKSIQYEDVFSK